MTLTRLIMRCTWLAMRERQGDSDENDGYIDSRRSPKLFGIRSDLRNHPTVETVGFPGLRLVKDLGYDHLADELWGAVGVFDAVQDAAEEDGAFTSPEADEETGQFHDDLFNDVLKKILDADKKEA